MTPNDEEITNASSMLKTLHYQINGKDVDFKAFVPFELEITLDGIGGCVVGQIFTIDQSILPRDYYNKNLGFVITGISHMLQNNDWTTTLKTQICLLDNGDYPSSVDKAKLKEAIATIKQQNQARGYIFYAMVDYIIYLMVRMMTDDGATKLKQPFLAGTQAVINGPGMDTAYFAPTRVQDALNRISDTQWESILPGGYGYTGENYGGGLTNYMKKWWETNKTNTSLPNFPTGSYDEFTQIVLPDGTKIMPSVMQAFIINFDRYLLDTKNLTKSLKIKDGFDPNKDFFLYKFFGSDPKAGLQNNNLITTKPIYKTIVQGAAATTKEVQDGTQTVINLKEIWAYSLGKVQDYINSVGQFAFIIQGNESPFTSLEIDIKGDGLYKLDTD
jgi:hypothetical protein